MPEFEADPKLEELAKAYARDTIDLAREHFGVDLGWDDASIKKLEPILEELHSTIHIDRPDDEKVAEFARGFGSYIGEVFRRNHRATWGWVTLDGDRVAGLRKEASGGLFWPWTKVWKRLRNGSEDNVWFYYNVVTGTPMEPLDLSEEKTRPRRSLLQRLFRRGR